MSCNMLFGCCKYFRQRVQYIGGFRCQFLHIFEMIFFSFFFVAIFDQVHDLEAIFHLPKLITASENLF